MWATNLKILGIVLGTIGLYTLLANAIPQVESDVPQELSFSGEVTVAEMVEAGAELYEGAGGCTACHGLGTRAPNLETGEAGEGPIGARCADRVSGMDCKAYLYASMIDPNAYLVEGFQPIMPDMRRTLSDAQIWAVVAYLQNLGGDVTVTAEDLATPAAEATDTGAAAAPAATNPVEIMDQYGCLACHQLGDQGQLVGPPFDGMGGRLDREQIRRGILDPAAEITPGYEQFEGVMPPNFGERLTAAQLEVLVEYLAEQR
ncbi:MAG TPA: c-type cytochrome [Gemmatimonadota bacterium]|nr:c-type cytochrome [Gemmatimonadota bacterium]